VGLLAYPLQIGILKWPIILTNGKLTFRDTFAEAAGEEKRRLMQKGFGRMVDEVGISGQVDSIFSVSLIRWTDRKIAGVRQAVFFSR
jgi:hypothetical protein